MSSILGGGGSKQSSTQTSGYSALPPELMSIFNQLGMGVGQYTNPNNPGVTAAFTPMQQTADETAAFNQIRQGFTPTAQSLQSDIAMQQNPFDQYVIGGINREAQGQNSILNQNLTKAGQFGSNRGMLGANDIDLSRLQQIGQFQQGQFNTSLNNAMNVLPQQRAADAQGLLGIGGFQRGLDSSTKLAPVSALQAGTGMISPFTAGGTQTSTQSGGGSGMLGGLGGLLSGAGNFGTAMGWLGGAGGASGLGSLASLPAFSDVRLKENIVPAGKENGHNIYVFSYKGNPKRYIGVMAQEILETNPEAVVSLPEGLAVNYTAIGVEFREVA